MEVEFLKKRTSKTSVDHVIDEILKAIIDHRWEAGEKIPSEPELAGALSVGRNSVREGVKALIANGILEIRRGEGTFVVSHFNDRTLNPLIFSLAIEKDMEHSLAELRQLMTVDSIELAAKNATPDDHQNIIKACQNLENVLRKEGCTPEEVLEADLAYHDAQAGSTHNLLFQRIQRVLLRLSRQSRLEELEFILSHKEEEKMIKDHWRETWVIINRGNTDVFEAVKDGFKYIDLISSSDGKSAQGV